ncbi:isoprenyl transferase [Aerococcus kribbianus]|uniref:Isoprenyl transferase n=1 Tax=Aerococcus kribbianus TaxID=2999064 RepID=A0A9X3JEM5_9LACT|nr:MULTISPECIES: isoprenyl transferase [unclassified Aerococcus]MCZ0716763.1 isoprenyl transferase [Aerococcus sp. YH-aer221]MCZ0725051.1 isoprenyl transferase [Aerococcus sp. YH-aer222]
MDQLNEIKETLPIPNHVAVIMDGNGRWAQERGQKRTEGHYEGLMALRRVVIAAHKLGVKVLTAYAFSTENWRRPAQEVNYLMQLPKILNDEILPDLIKNNVQVRLSGDLSAAPKLTQSYIKNALEKTKNNTGLILNIAFNYGSRNEITQAVQTIAKEVETGELKPKAIDETVISQHLMTAQLGDYADPDFLIRSSGEVRLSNYLLWQLAYAELYFVDTKWPDFDEEVFKECILEYQRRHRRFGKTSEQINSK